MRLAGTACLLSILEQQANLSGTIAGNRGTEHLSMLSDKL